MSVTFIDSLEGGTRRTRNTRGSEEERKLNTFPQDSSGSENHFGLSRSLPHPLSCIFELLVTPSKHSPVITVCFLDVHLGSLKFVSLKEKPLTSQETCVRIKKFNGQQIVKRSFGKTGRPKSVSLRIAWNPRLPQFSLLTLGTGREDEEERNTR